MLLGKFFSFDDVARGVPNAPLYVAFFKIPVGTVESLLWRLSRIKRIDFWQIIVSVKLSKFVLTHLFLSFFLQLQFLIDLNVTQGFSRHSPVPIAFLPRIEESCSYRNIEELSLSAILALRPSLSLYNFLSSARTHCTKPTLACDLSRWTDEAGLSGCLWWSKKNRCNIYNNRFTLENNYHFENVQKVRQRTK